MADAAPNRRVLVTGGGRGLGAAIVRTLAADGHDVTFTYRTAAAQADTLVNEIASRHPHRAVMARELDLSDRAKVDAFVVAIESEAPYFAFVHNAGQSYDSLAAMMDQGKAEQIMQVNFWSFTRLVTALVRPMTHARTGRIVVIGSVSATRGSQGNAAYSASKAALLGYVRTLAVETARHGVTVNYVAPGFIDTEMLAPYAAHRARIEKQIPIGRLAAPEDIAGIVAFLLGPAASYLTGSVLPVDGGLSAAIGIHR